MVVSVFIFLYFVSIFRQKNITKFPSLHSMLSLILKTTCLVFLETFLNYLQAYRGFQFERNHHGDLYDHYCLKSKLKVFIFFPFRCVYNVHRSFCLFPANTDGPFALCRLGLHCCCITKRCHKDTLPFYNSSFNFAGIFSFHSIVFLVIILPVAAV